MRFELSNEAPAGLLVTPWGHGEWGVVPSRADVLYAEFAQQRYAPPDLTHRYIG